MPGLLGKVDDPWGVTWRARNLARRLSARRTTRFLAAWMRDVRHERPVFVLGAPRSGTTLIFRLLRESPELGSLAGEGHDLWRTFHHPRSSGWDSDALGPGEVRRGERRYVDAWLASHFAQCRFVEKTPENCLRVPYLLELFPDALFVTVRRNPCDVISSLIGGWRDPASRYRSYFVPEDLEIPGHRHRRMWCFALIEGWRGYASSPVPEIAFAQWDQCTAAIEAARPLVPSARWVDLHLEELSRRGFAAVEGLWSALGLAEPLSAQARLAELLADPPNALTQPAVEKWRRDHPAEIAALLPRIAVAADSRGYEVDPGSGAFRVTPPTGP